MVIFVENDVFMQRWWFANFSMEDKMGWLWIAKSSPFGLPQNKDPQIGSVFSALFFRLQSILIWSPGPGPSKTLVFFSFLVHNPKNPAPYPPIFGEQRFFGLAFGWHAQAEISADIKEHAALQYVRVLVQAASQRQTEAGPLGWTG